MRINKRKQAGLAAVALVLLIGSTFMLMTSGVGNSVDLGLTHATRTSISNRTSYAALGSLQAALDALNTNNTYSCDDLNNKTPLVADPEMMVGMSVYNNFIGSTNITAPDGKNIPPRMVYIKVEADLRDYPGKFRHTFASKAYVGTFLPDCMVLGTMNVTLTNTSVDGFDSGGSPQTSRIMTNSVSPNAITVTGTGPTSPDSKVKSAFRWGPGGADTCLNVSNGAEAPIVASEKRALLFPMRVARFRPPYDPKKAVGNLVNPPSPLQPNALLTYAYANITVTNATLDLPAGDLFVSGSVYLNNATINCLSSTGENPTDLYIGENFTCVNSSKVNFTHVPPGSTGGPAGRDSSATGGPRTLNVYFVGSGSPQQKINQFVVTDCSNTSGVCLHAAGKAMAVNVTNSEVWGGFKGMEFHALNSKLHYNRVNLIAQQPNDALRIAAKGQTANLLGAVGLLAPELFPYLTTTAVNNYNLNTHQPKSAWSIQGLADDEAEGGEPVVYDGGS